MRDELDVVVGVAASLQQRLEFHQVGDGVEVGRRLLAAEAAVEVGADADVPGVAGQLADVVDVIDERRASRRRSRASFCRGPSRDDHPGVERRADDRAAVDERADLLVVELPLVGTSERQLLWLAQTGPSKDRAPPESFVGEVGGVEDDAQPLHLAQQLAAESIEAAGGVRALRITPGP